MSNPPSPETPDQLGALLCHEDYFESVLQRLDDVDLRQCRIVCRLWRDAFKAFPLHLSRKRDRSVQEVMRSFPGAAAMFLKIAKDESPEDVFCRLITSRNLRRLSVKSYQPWTEVEAATDYFPSLDQLQELSLKWWGEVKCPSIYSSLRFFTNLTTLKLKSSVVDSDALEFLPMLQKLKEIHFSLDLLTNADDTLHFPVLTQVTHLDIETERQNFSRGWESLELVYGYRHTLPSLDFAFPSRQERFHNMCLLTAFTRLERLRLYSHCEEPILVTSTNFLEVLKDMTHLAALEVELKPTRCSPGSDFAPRVLYALTRLRSLCLSRAPPRLSLRGLTALTYLEIANSAENVLKLEESLAKMPQLERLHLGFNESCEATVPRSVLAELPKLRDIYLRDAIVDEDM